MGRHLLWTDIETTGLHANAQIIQLGMVVTDANLNTIAEFEEVIRYRPNELQYQPEALAMHQKSGLWRKVPEAPFDLDEVRTLARSFALKNAGEKPFLAGSSVHFDHRYLLRSMPELVELCHYRMLDVSVFKVLGQLWEFKGWENPLNGSSKHTALSDIHDSIATLEWYRENVLGHGAIGLDELRSVLP